MLSPGKTLYWHPTGPMLRYSRDMFGEMLHVDDLNPENHIEFRLTPIELLKLGFKCIAAACLP